MSQPRAADYIKRRTELRAWAQKGQSSTRSVIVNDLADIASAAAKIVALVDKLAGPDESSADRTLVEIQAWLYDELLEHASQLRPKLQAAIDDAYQEQQE